MGRGAGGGGGKEVTEARGGRRCKGDKGGGN